MRIKQYAKTIYRNERGIDGPRGKLYIEMSEGSMVQGKTIYRNERGIDGPRENYI